MDTIIQVQHLKKRFKQLEVLHDINFDIHKGEVVTIIGSSGSGKSTLLRCINLLERLDDGHILYHDQDILDRHFNVNQYRSKVGMVFQGFNLFNNLTVLENCMIGQIKVLKRNKEEAKQMAFKYLEKVGMSAFANKSSVQLLSLIHIFFLNIYGKGVVIRGDSGIGKSEIALELIKRGHFLIADDAIELYHIGQGLSLIHI